MCAGAFSYLYGIDASALCDEFVYPKDMIDFARSSPGNAVIDEHGGSLLCVVGGDCCQMEGIRFTVGNQHSVRHFALGDLRPAIERPCRVTSSATLCLTRFV